MKESCIYCGNAEDLSKSDIIPDALTNAKILNPYVCRIEHNSKFSDLFESEIISKLAFITNELNIKSSKGKTYAAYDANILIGDTAYKTKLVSDSNLFSSNKKMRSIDDKALLGTLSEIQKIKEANDANITEIDINQMEIEKRVFIDLSVYFSQEMFKLVSKIAFEWYCLKNEIKNKREEFNSVIDFITTDKKNNNIVSFINNKEIYDILKDNTSFGSHVLLTYVADDNSINVIVNLFGIAMYNIRLCNKPVDSCQNNIIFQELTLDAKHISFISTNIAVFKQKFIESFETQCIAGIKVMIPKDLMDTTLQHKMMYLTYYETWKKNLRLEVKLTKETNNLLLANIKDILAASDVTLRSLKRFVKEHQKNFDEGLKLNPNGTNKKSVFMFYILLLIGKSNGAIKNLDELNIALKTSFGDSTINISDELCKKLSGELSSEKDNLDYIASGAKTVSEWKYN